MPGNERRRSGVKTTTWSSRRWCERFSIDIRDVMVRGELWKNCATWIVLVAVEELRNY